jgi:hypothetical protein
VNKADGHLLTAAQHTAGEYTHALHFQVSCRSPSIRSGVLLIGMTSPSFVMLQCIQETQVAFMDADRHSLLFD